MSKIKRLINSLRIRYYESMMAYCVDGWEYARLDHDESHEECMYWVERYNKYDEKLHKILPME